jgi:hypothetical protein
LNCCCFDGSRSRAFEGVLPVLLLTKVDVFLHKVKQLRRPITSSQLLDRLMQNYAELRRLFESTGALAEASDRDVMDAVIKAISQNMRKS